MKSQHLRLVQSFINLPTAPFVESAGLAFIRDFVRRRPALSMKSDRFGNLLVRYHQGKPPRGVRPILLAAHLDHPGFIAERMLDARTLRAAWRGWVRPEYFAGSRVRFWTGDGWLRGKITDTIAGDPTIAAPQRGPVKPAPASGSFGAESPPQAVIVRVPRAAPAGAPGMWDFPDARLVGGRLHARACDDVVGAAGILCFLDDICRLKPAAECYAFFTRAEEVGFGGALAAVADRGLPRDCIVVAIECSRAIAGVSLGAGPVLRVGDKASIFTPAATAFCQVVAEDLAHKDKTFAFQRKLMDGGTCESTVYCAYGYDATGLCLPLLNYHNMDTEPRRIAPEIIDLGDLEKMIGWFVALVRTDRRYTGGHPGLHERLDALLKKNRPLLLATSKHV